MSMKDTITVEITRQLVEQVFGTVPDTKWDELKSHIEITLKDIAWEDIEEELLSK